MVKKKESRYFVPQDDDKKSTAEKKCEKKSEKSETEQSSARHQKKLSSQGDDWHVEAQTAAESSEHADTDIQKHKGGALKWNDHWRKNDEKKFTEVPIIKEKMKKYKRGHGIHDLDSHVRTAHHKHMQHAEQVKFRKAAKQAAKSELLLQEDAGYLEADEGESTSRVSQVQLRKHVDITSATKSFDLNMDKFGPYTCNYTKNGRKLIMAGGRGHCAAIDWQTKDLLCEFNVMETIQDAKWLHNEEMFAVAQKQWVYIYDNLGTEIHCLKALDHVLQMEFLPYHFLLATASAKSYLAWLDVSIGEKVLGFPTGLGRLDVMCQNPSNGIINLAHTNGRVTMWSPNNKEPLVKMFCHQTGIRSIAIDKTGNYMATSALERRLKIWDIRMFREVYCYKQRAVASSLNFSDRDMLAAGIGNVVEVYKEVTRCPIDSAYMCHRGKESVRRVEFCPYEDILGMGHRSGFSSLIIPGCGEPNFDAFEANPYATTKQTQHREVKALLEKIQPEMITMDTSALGKVVEDTEAEMMEEKLKNANFETDKIENLEMKKKHGRKGKSGHTETRKALIKGTHERDQLKARRLQQKIEKRKERRKAKRENNNEEEDESDNEEGEGNKSVLDRFKKKKRVSTAR